MLANIHTEAADTLQQWCDSLRTTQDVLRDTLCVLNQTIENLNAQNELLQVRSNVNVLSAVLIIGVVMIFFMWGIRERNKKHTMLLERKNNALQLANRVAEDAREFAEHESHLKTIFIKNMSHEIRTPLNHIYGFAQLMINENIPTTEEELKQMAQYIHESSAHLTKVVDNISEVTSKLENRTELLDVESVLKTKKE